MPDLGKAYVQIVPSAQGISGSITNMLSGETAAAGKAGGESIGSNLVSTLKGVVAAAGIGTIIKEALDAGGAIQQSFGGLDTIYGEASGQLKEYANAAAAAGISANDYAEQAVSFGAALKSSYGGDTVKAAEAANAAIMAIADNSAKMGTDIGSVTMAYQGFAKQNYTMLDNLKLGYGGTKTEMERLLADAEKLTGVHYDIDSLGDVYNAIGVIQENLGLAGVAAEEAKTTFSGSMGAMKASLTNFLASMALGEGVGESLGQLLGTVQTFVFDNLLPLLGNLVMSIPEALATAAPLIRQSLLDILGKAPQLAQTGLQMIQGLTQGITNGLPQVLARGVEIINGLVNGILQGIPQMMTSGSQTITQFLGAILTAVGQIRQAGVDILMNLLQGLAANLPQIAATASQIITQMVTTLSSELPQMLAQGVEVITQLVGGIMQALPELMTAGGEALNSFIDAVLTMVPQVLQTGADLLLNLINGILSNLPQLITSAGQIVTQLITTITSHLPEILAKGVEIVGQLATGVLNNMPQIIASIAQVVAQILATLLSHMPEILAKGLEIIAQLAAGIIRGIPDLVKKIPEVINAIKDAFLDFDWLEIGKDILKGVAEGISKGASILGEAISGVAGGAVDKLKGLLGIGSPSTVMRDEVGQWIPAGVALGIRQNLGLIDEAMAGAALSTASSYQRQMAGWAPGQLATGNADETLRYILELLVTYFPEFAKARGQDGQDIYGELNRRLGMAVYA